MAVARVRAVLVDSNVILDVVTDDPEWCTWSAERLQSLAEDHLLVINPIICPIIGGEGSIGFDRIEDLEAALPSEAFQRENLPWAAAFLAGNCYLRYRWRGVRRSPLPDRFIGAHAAVRGIPLLTRDARRYRTCFPSLTLIAP